MSPHMLSSTACRLTQRQASPAIFFIRHCQRCFSTSGVASTPVTKASLQPIPDFLLPSRKPWRPSNRLLSRSASSPQCYQQRFAFSSTAASRAATVVQNPRTDDDGNPLWINISPRAARRLREITDPESSSISTTLNENPYHHLRITVTSGGCHGFQYLMSLESASKIDAEEDTVFEAEPSPDDDKSSNSTAKGQAKVVMDGPSLELLSGSTVDYTTELIGSQFKIVDNPRATSNCGCGTSFDVKD
ncbi:hypothetical protein VTN77DRAFT_1776 [Rasamsonia byssochlamydoides]|uniref:uncharacterized protein n=1 Tax=Rasamsonia byssochlamydoides TaxID=89139 RepID=UPI0037443734